MGSNGRFTVPASSVSFNTGRTLKGALAGGEVNATLRAADPPPGLCDGDIDAWQNRICWQTSWRA